MVDKQLWLEQVNLKGSVGSQYILENISFNVFQGDRIAIVGPSGAGKTSLLRLLNRLTDASGGNIYLEGQEIREIPVLQLRQQVTLVQQESKLLGMTVQEALSYPLNLRNLPQSTIQQRLDTWMELVRLPSEWLTRSEAQLSVGQRQLVAIARALMIQPKILLLDEPTSALDAGRGFHLLNILSNVVETTHVTILMVNHQLELAQQFCSRVLFLQKGRLIHNLPQQQANWNDLKDQLLDAEAQEADEWA
jgi:D-methionine transport system ATP-binding protein